eukprot:gnl/MRDRNA2_/MRDRNA2_23586_c0_seq1.p1 gnl/MRDRNA2_/MRDRNA2_23586_c0~~gnl/MRDRNA2_/MRDRNA2_23586_c0_seq1.p1  ORF type:complete len:193 (-),score=39.77 gnl/MRDRNA2_/MRDRNA2_23586_c0_seq1:25-603(-)
MAPLQLVLLPVDRVEEVSRVESASYPADEAADLDQIRFRQANAQEVFMGLFGVATDLPTGEAVVVKFEGPSEGNSVQGLELVGFVNGTLAAGEELDHDSMSAHDPSGSTLCIHSVVTAEAYRRRGYAKAMLQEYMKAVRSTVPQLQRILLLCKNHLIPFYESCGFTNLGESKVVHGQDKWYDMKYVCCAPAA